MYNIDRGKRYHSGQLCDFQPCFIKCPFIDTNTVSNSIVRALLGIHSLWGLKAEFHT